MGYNIVYISVDC